MRKIGAAQVLEHALLLNQLQKQAMETREERDARRARGAENRAKAEAAAAARTNATQRGIPYDVPTNRSGDAPSMPYRAGQAVGAARNWVNANPVKTVAGLTGLAAIPTALAMTGGEEEAAAPAASFNPQGAPPPVPTPAPAAQDAPLLGAHSLTGSNLGDAAVGAAGVAGIVGLYQLLRDKKKQAPQLVMA